MRMGGEPARPAFSTAHWRRARRAWRAARRQVTWAIWQPVTRAKLAVAGSWSRSLSQVPTTSSTTAAAGEVAYIPAFWSQAEVSQSAARAAGGGAAGPPPKKHGAGGAGVAPFDPL